MSLTEYNFELPEHLIASYPSETRTGCRLMALDRQTGEVQHHDFKAILDYLKPGDCLVLNDTKVIRARLYGQKASGGHIELLLERIQRVELSETGPNIVYCLVHIGANRAPKPDQRLIFQANMQAKVIRKQGKMYEVAFISDQPFGEWLELYGNVPLPPYMNREAEEADVERYQTVYAQQAGAIAAPTAGLHFDHALLKTIEEKGIKIVRLTLHVGSGTFQPVQVEDFTQHTMHSEWMQLSQNTVDEITACKTNGGRVIAVGTTSVRALETASQSGQLQPYEGDTDIFIYPGFEFKTVDAMITNFHIPQSTLMLLISAFAGKENVMNAYDQAVKAEYKFYSYGDAMWIG